MSELRSVACQYDGCGAETTIPTEIPSPNYNASATGWEVTLTCTDESGFTIDRAYCPDHTVDELLDDVADSVRSFGNSFTKTMQVADELADT